MMTYVSNQKVCWEKQGRLRRYFREDIRRYMCTKVYEVVFEGIGDVRENTGIYLL